MMLYHVYRRLPLPAKNILAASTTYLLKPALRRHFSEFVDAGDLVFDIGAHAGLYTSLFLDLGASVVAVEPQPVCIQTLQTRYGADPRVTIVAEGVGAAPGILPLFIAENATTNSTFSRAWQAHPRLEDRSWDVQVTTPVSTLEALIGRFGVPDFCKIDVEGYELNVLRGLRKPLPALSFEFDECFFANMALCVQALEGLGAYEYNFALYTGTRLASRRWLSASALLSTLNLSRNGHLRGDVYARSLSWS